MLYSSESTNIWASDSLREELSLAGIVDLKATMQRIVVNAEVLRSFRSWWRIEMVLVGSEFISW